MYCQSQQVSTQFTLFPFFCAIFCGKHACIRSICRNQLEARLVSQTLLNTINHPYCSSQFISKYCASFDYLLSKPLSIYLSYLLCIYEKLFTIFHPSSFHFCLCIVYSIKTILDEWLLLNKFTTKHSCIIFHHVNNVSRVINRSKETFWSISSLLYWFVSIW